QDRQGAPRGDQGTGELCQKVTSPRAMRCTMRLHYFPPEIKKRPAAAVLSALGMLLTAAASWLWAHEGHAPLPTKGAQVDVVKGRVTLSSEARDTLGVQTAEVGPRTIEENVFAYATLV